MADLNNQGDTKMTTNKDDAGTLVDHLLASKLKPHYQGVAIYPPHHSTKRGDQLASRHEVVWTPIKTKLHFFASTTTTPQQDLKADHTGVNIRASTKNRAQPWACIVRANIHDIKVKSLPAKEASTTEVKEWIYLVLTQRKYAKHFDTVPQLVTATLLQVKFDGAGLRERRTPASWNICPKKCVNVDFDVIPILPHQRKYICQALQKTILPLLQAELDGPKEKWFSGLWKVNNERKANQESSSRLRSWLSNLLGSENKAKELNEKAWSIASSEDFEKSSVHPQE